jgi:hypothetical protein
MLDPHYKQRIRAEEIFRDEVRKQLKGPSVATGRVFELLNKPFVIWALSSLILAGVTALYAAWQGHQTEAKKRGDMIEKLDFEIDARFSQFLESMEDLVAEPHSPAFAFKPSATQEDIESRLKELKAPPSRNAHGWVVGVYPEFEKTGLPALIMQLRSEVADEHEKLNLKAAGKELSQLHSLMPSGHEFLQVWKDLRLRGILLDRWNQFWYTDCGTTPFC